MVTSLSPREFAVKHRNDGVIFTSMAARAVHRDIVTGVSMDKRLTAIDHFLSQYRDVMKAFYSDNGTNFQGVESG